MHKYLKYSIMLLRKVSPQKGELLRIINNLRFKTKAFHESDKMRNIELWVTPLKTNTLLLQNIPKCPGRLYETGAM